MYLCFSHTLIQPLWKNHIKFICFGVFFNHIWLCEWYVLTFEKKKSKHYALKWQCIQVNTWILCGRYNKQIMWENRRNKTTCSKCGKLTFHLFSNSNSNALRSLFWSGLQWNMSLGMKQTLGTSCENKNTCSTCRNPLHVKNAWNSLWNVQKPQV